MEIWPNEVCDTLPFLILVMIFLIHLHLISDMCKSFKTCSLFAISIFIRVKVRLEFSVLFSLSRYIFSLFFHFSCIYYFYFVYIYLCCDDFLLYITCEFPISVSHVITLITSKYSMISQKNSSKFDYSFSLCLYLARLFLPSTMEKRCPYCLSRLFFLVSRSFLLPLVYIHHISR